jgi:hypothetical protein
MTDAAFDLLRTGNADVFASVRGELVKYSTQLPGSRVLQESYGANRFGMAVAKGQAAERLAYMSEFHRRGQGIWLAPTNNRPLWFARTQCRAFDQNQLKGTGHQRGAKQEFMLSARTTNPESLLAGVTATISGRSGSG